VVTLAGPELAGAASSLLPQEERITVEIINIYKLVRIYVFGKFSQRAVIMAV
jgi:hypothetical protein